MSTQSVSFRWATGVLVSSVLLILVATLTPFDFTAEDVTLESAIRGFFSHPSDLADVVGNVFFFMPFGISFASELYHQRIRKRVLIVLVLFSSALLSLSVETLQVFLPSRSSSWIDVCTNTTGGTLGAIAYFIWCAKAPPAHSVAAWVRKWITIRVLAISFITWILLTFGVCFALQQAAQLSNWDVAFPLVVGNEQTGDRAWKGTVSKLEISDRALSETEAKTAIAQQGSLPPSSLIAAYSLIGAGNYRDRTGNLPDLVWQSANPPNNPAFSERNWLSTAQAATKLSAQLKRSSEFSFSVTAAAAETNQQGPARIVSVSANPFERNITLGQEKQSFVIRLRTPITGKNGVFTALSVPGVFGDTKPHQLLVTYEHSVLRVYVDRIENLYSLELTPEITLFRYLFPFEGRIVRLTNFSISLYTFMFYSVFFVPLGVILAIVASSAKGEFRFYLLLSTLGIVVPALLLEISMRKSYLRIENLVISIAIALLTMLLVKSCLTKLLRY